jgi:hypothetical protein
MVKRLSATCHPPADSTPRFRRGDGRPGPAGTPAEYRGLAGAIYDKSMTLAEKIVLPAQSAILAYRRNLALTA